MNENGEVRLDDPVSKWLPDLALPNADKVTLAMLADSTSGYPDYVPNDTFANAFLGDPFKGFTPQELIDIGLSSPPLYKPGTAWNYAHTNYVILGEALASAGGKPLGDLLTERVIERKGILTWRGRCGSTILSLGVGKSRMLSNLDFVNTSWTTLRSITRASTTG